MPTVSKDVRRKCWRAAVRFEGVGELRPQDIDARVERRSLAYRDAILLARLLLTNLGPALNAGNEFGWTFLLPTTNAVENGVRAILADYFEPYSPVTKGHARINAFSRVHPDLWFESLDAVGDVKYKIFGESFIRSDLYQSVAFAAAFQSRRAVLVGFQGMGGQCPVPATFGDIKVMPCPWPADGDTTPVDAAHCMCDEVARFLGLPESAGARIGRGQRERSFELADSTRGTDVDSG